MMNLVTHERYYLLHLIVLRTYILLQQHSLCPITFFMFFPIFFDDLLDESDYSSTLFTPFDFFSCFWLDDWRVLFCALPVAIASSCKGLKDSPFHANAVSGGILMVNQTTITNGWIGDDILLIAMFSKDVSSYTLHHFKQLPDRWFKSSDASTLTGFMLVVREFTVPVITSSITRVDIGC